MGYINQGRLFGGRSCATILTRSGNCSLFPVGCTCTRCVSCVLGIGENMKTVDWCYRVQEMSRRIILLYYVQQTPLQGRHVHIPKKGSYTGAVAPKL